MTMEIVETNALVPIPEKEPPGSPIVLDHKLQPQENPAIVYLANLSLTGRRTQTQVTRVIADLLGGTIDTVDWGKLTFAHTSALRTLIRDEEYSPSSIRKFYSALRGILKAAYQLGQISNDDYQRAIDLGSVSGETLPAGRYIPQKELKALFDTCQEDNPTNRRDAAMLAVMAGCGLRRQEVVEIMLDDWDMTNETITIHGKRNRERHVYIQNGILTALNEWLEVRGKEPGPLFLSVYGDVIKQGRALNSNAVYAMVQRRADKAKIAEFSPHSLRRTFCSDLLDRGVDIATVAKLAGHAMVQTTALYDRRPEIMRKEGAKKINVPVPKRPIIRSQSSRLENKNA